MRTLESAPWQHNGWISGGDVITAAKLTGCLVAALTPASLWPAASRLMARVHLRLRDGCAQALATCSAVEEQDVASAARSALAADYLSNIQAVREILPGGWRCELPIAGRASLDRALERSRGAVLWCSPFVASDLAPKKALALAGYRLTALSAPSHPFSPTRFGALFLNPVRLRALARYLSLRVLVVHGNARPALEMLEQVLRENGVVVVMAVGTGRRTFSHPFLGGTIDLAAGGPLLAYRTGAALIPVFTLPGPQGYRVELGAELTAPSNVPEPVALSEMATRYVELLEPVVKANPSSWEGWFHPETWRPAEPGAAGR
jgi:lauroyl/myristoyl acyltransferase